jgi:uncharacterized protein YabN with tetrapyrrole methylase and pyrophosphatase domain
MKIKHLKEALSKYPDDMEVLVVCGTSYDGEITIRGKSLYHANYTSKWQSCVDFYSECDEPCVYKDEVNGKIMEMKVSTERKEFVILD